MKPHARACREALLEESPDSAWVESMSYAELLKRVHAIGMPLDYGSDIPEEMLQVCARILTDPVGSPTTHVTRVYACTAGLL